MKYFKNIIGAALVILLALFIINFHDIERLSPIKETVKGWFGLSKQKVDVLKHNLSFDFAPQRRRPLSLMAQEAKLGHLAKNVFGQFSPSEWNDFWNLVYEPIEEKQGDLMVKRYRTKEEIENYLEYNHSDPFSFFREQHWEYFWSIVFGGSQEE